jgi:hypothetical protein
MFLDYGFEGTGLNMTARCHPVKLLGLVIEVLPAVPIYNRTPNAIEQPSSLARAVKAHCILEAIAHRVASEHKTA